MSQARKLASMLDSQMLGHTAGFHEWQDVQQTLYGAIEDLRGAFRDKDFGALLRMSEGLPNIVRDAHSLWQQEEAERPYSGVGPGWKGVE